MKQLIHDLVTGVKYLYPCVAYEEQLSSLELVIITETDLDRLYPAVPSVAGMVYQGEDFWGRETFKNAQGQYFGSVDGTLYFKGNDPEGEPHWPVKEVIEYTMPTIDPDIVEFKPGLEKAQEFFANHPEVKLVDTKVSISSPTREGKIVARYTVKIKG